MTDTTTDTPTDNKAASYWRAAREDFEDYLDPTSCLSMDECHYGFSFVPHDPDEGNDREDHFRMILGGGGPSMWLEFYPHDLPTRATAQRIECVHQGWGPEHRVLISADTIAQRIWQRMRGEADAARRVARRQ